MRLHRDELEIEPYVYHHRECHFDWMQLIMYRSRDFSIVFNILRGKSSLSDFYYAFKLDNFTINLFTLRLRRKMLRREKSAFNVMHGRRFFPPNIIAAFLTCNTRQFLNFSLSLAKEPAALVMKHAGDKTFDVMTFRRRGFVLFGATS